ncbi:hypothetical protein D3C81_1836760 [compost metagenome]
MLAAGQLAQHGQRVVAVERLAEDAPVQYHRGIGAEHADVGALGEHVQAGLGLVPRQAFDIGLGGFGGKRSFVDIGGNAVERHGDLRQKLSATRRTGGQVKLRHLDSQVG